VSTGIAAALSDGVAVIGLANASLKQRYINAIILGATQKALGLAASALLIFLSVSEPVHRFT